MPKNIVIFSDGTGQEGGENINSNIYKIFNMVEDRTDQQIAFYDSGVGSGWYEIFGKMFGFGLSKNIQECYRFIFDNFQSGDQIYLFGFSRGATTVRSLSGFIHLFGILPNSRPELIEEAYKIYKIKNEKKREKKANEFIDLHRTMWTKIKFLGCFDTVAALGTPWKGVNAILSTIPLFLHKFHNLKLSDSVEHARHALSLDENRKPFLPTLWDPLPNNLQNQERIKQIWFSGVHTDIGGGYAEHGLSDITLNWMIKEAKDKGLLIYSKNNVEKNIRENVEDTMHDEYKGKFKLTGKAYRSWDHDKYGPPHVHPTAYQRTKNRQNENLPKYEVKL